MPGAGSGKGNPAYSAYRLLWTAIDWVYPPHCAGCGAFGERFCRSCLSQVVKIRPPYCQKCGQPTDDLDLCPICRSSSPAFDSLRSWAIFSGPLREAMHRMKYRRDLGLGEVFGGALAGFFRSQNWRVDLVVPVPLSAERMRARGYNQAALLAWPLALACRTRYNPGVLQRVRETPSQVGLSLEERRKNVSAAFCADPRQVSQRSVLIVDDVATTGSTIEACAQALKDAGAERVYGLTLARALARNHSDYTSADTPDVLMLTTENVRVNKDRPNIY